MDLGTEYDYKSIMHYPDNAFGIPTGLKTIISKTKTKDIENEVNKVHKQY